MAALTIQNIQSLLSKFPQTFEKAYDLENKLLTGENKVIPMKSHRPGVGVVNRTVGGNQSTGQIADGADLPAAGQSNKSSLTYGFPIFFNQIELGRRQIKQAGTRQAGIDILRHEIGVAASDLGQKVNRRCYTNEVGSPTAVVAAGAVGADVSFDVTDPSGYRVNATLEVWDAAKTTKIGEFFVVDIDIQDAASTITARPSVPTAIVPAIGATDVILLKGSNQPPGDDYFASLGDAASKTAAVYGLTPGAGGPEWRGFEDDSGGLFSPAKLKKLLARMKMRGSISGCKILLGPTAESALYEDNVPNIQFVGDKVDKYDKNMTFEGLEVFVDNNAPLSQIHIFNPMFTKQDVLKKPGFDTDGGKDAKGNEAIHVSQTRFSYIVQNSCMLNLAHTKRSSLGRLTNLTY